MPDNVRKYLFYAIGEVALVMVGILLALQVSNWNEDRRNYQLENEYLIRLHEDIKLSLENVTSIEGSLKEHTDLYNQMTLLLQEGELPPEDFGTFAHGLYRLGKIPAPPLVTGTLRELNATGRIVLIRNDSLRMALQDLESNDDEFREILNYIVERISPPTTYVDSKVILIPDENGEIFPPERDWSKASDYFVFDFRAMAEDPEMKAAVSLSNHVFRVLGGFNKNAGRDYAEIEQMLRGELELRALMDQL